MGGRSFGTLQPSRGLVYLDGYLLSNFLGRFDAPRWNMVTPEALERVDVLYGPFSAIHAGNSIGTTIVMTERTPRRVEWGVGLTGYGQGFEQYGQGDDYGGGQLSAYAGTRLRFGALGRAHLQPPGLDVAADAVLHRLGERVGRLPGGRGRVHAGVRHPLRRRPQGATGGRSSAATRAPSTTRCRTA